MPPRANTASCASRLASSAISRRAPATCSCRARRTPLGARCSPPRCHARDDARGLRRCDRGRRHRRPSRRCRTESSLRPRAERAHGSARCSRARTVAVVPGFIGRAPDGSIATLGRGGSDLTATLLARALSARKVVLWKDVPGILTADPAAGARRAADPAAPSPRGRGGCALRREGSASARADPDRRHAHHAARAIVPQTGPTRAPRSRHVARSRPIP